MNLMPVKSKISIDKWMNQTVKYDKYTLKDIISDFTSELYEYLNYSKEFVITLDKYKILKDIIQIIYNNNYDIIKDYTNYEYFSLKFNEDIYEIYYKYYNIISIDIGHNIIKNNYMIIFDYIYDIIEFMDENDDSEYNSEDYEFV